MKTIAFFNNKGGVGKTTLVYHLAWMYSQSSARVLAVDLDPQANATAMFLTDDRLEDLFDSDSPQGTVFNALKPLLDGSGDIKQVDPVAISDRIWLMAGDLAMSEAEDELGSNCTNALDGKERAFRVLSAIWRTIVYAAQQHLVDVVLIDVGPNLGALNRAALICADSVVVPLAPDIYSLQGLRNLGPTLIKWRDEWNQRLRIADRKGMPFMIPRGSFQPLGYVVLQHAVRTDRSVKAYDKWMSRIPRTYALNVLMEDTWSGTADVTRDPNCLAMLKNYRSLMPLAQEAHKPMFLLRAVDGAIGGHALAVQDCYRDFQSLVYEIDRRASLSIPVS